MGLLNITTGECLSRVVQKNADSPAVIEYSTGRTLSWKELEDQVVQVAKGLMKAGIGKGDKLVIWSVNNIEWIVCFLATAKIGGVVVPGNIHLKKPELQDLLFSTEARAICLSDGYRGSDFSEVAGDLCSLGEESGSKNHHLNLCLCLGKKKNEAFLSLDEIKTMGEALSQEQYEEAVASVTPDEILNIQMTSGSTARPRGGMLSHYSIINNAFLSAQRLGITSSDRLCLAVPLFHCFGLSSGLFFSLNTGCCLVLLEAYCLEDVFESIQKYRCSVLHGVPTMFSRLLKYERFDQYDIESLSRGIVAGAYCGPSLIKQIHERMGITELAVSYGQTEASPCCTQTLPADSVETKSTSIGKPLPYVEMKIADPKTGAVCETGRHGEICTRGFHVMKGYYNDPKQTSRTIDSEGWLHTGDIGFVDEEGYYHYSCRLKEIIIRGGENISPQEVESAILGFPAVEYVKVFGLKTDDLGEVVAASIFLKDGQAFSEEGLRAFLGDQIAHYKIPVYIDLLDNLPYLSNGKVDVMALRKKLEIKAGKEAVAGESFGGVLALSQ